MGLTMHNAILPESVVVYRVPLFTAPEAPVNLEAIEVSPHAMNLTWEHPSITNGRLRRFEVQVKLVSSKLRKQEGEIKIPKYQLEMNITKMSKVYSYKVSEICNLNFLEGVIYIWYCFIYLLFCTCICIDIVMLQKDIIRKTVVRKSDYSS
jgi:hypothetical protein